MPPAGSVARGLVILALVAVLGLVVVATGAAQGSGQTARVEVRVWQDVGDELDIYVSARPANGLWQTLGTIPLPLDDGVSATGYRYGDLALEVPLPDGASLAAVEVRVWQNVGNSRVIYISARPAGGDWDVLGRIPLPLDDGVSAMGFRYGDISLDVPVPPSEVSTLAGWPGVEGYVDGQGDEARFGAFGYLLQHQPWALGLAADRDGSVVVADYYNNAIRRIAPDGMVTTVAGAGQGMLDGEAALARFSQPRDVAVDPQGTIYVADEGNNRIRKITADGVVTTAAGTGQSGYGDGPAEEALFESPLGVALGPLGDLYIIERTRIRRLSPSGQVSTFAGGARRGTRDGWRENAQFSSLQDIAIDDSGNIFVINVSDSFGDMTEYSSIRLIDTSGTVSTLLRSEGLNLGGALGFPGGIAPAGDGGVYLSNSGLNQIIRVTRTGEIEGVAGTGEGGYLNGLRSEARFSLPGSIAVSSTGVLFVADQAATVVRTVDLGGRGLPVSPVPLAQHEGPPRIPGVVVAVVPLPESFFPVTMVLDPDGNLVTSAQFRHEIQQLSPDGTVTTLAGGNGEGFLDGPGDEAQFSQPRLLAVDAEGAVFVLDTGNQAIRRVAPDGTVTTVLDPLPMRVWAIEDMAVDQDGNLLIVEGSSIWRLRDGALSPAGDAQGRWIKAIDVDESGQIHVAAGFTGLVGRIDETGGFTTLLEDRPGWYGGVLSGFSSGIAAGSDGTVYVLDFDYQRVLSISPEGEVAIVVDRESFPGVRTFYPTTLLWTPEGDLLVGDGAGIWRVTLP